MPLPKKFRQRDWSVILGGLSYRRDSLNYYLNLAKLSPEYEWQDVVAMDKGSQLPPEALLLFITGFDFSNTLAFGCPILLFEGRHDYTTPSQVPATWLASVKAPDKKLVWFENSTHLIMVEEPGRFLIHLVQDARPYAERAGDVPNIEKPGR